jgi:hypothetical protein
VQGEDSKYEIYGSAGIWKRLQWIVGLHK